MTCCINCSRQIMSILQTPTELRAVLWFWGLRPLLLSRLLRKRLQIRDAVPPSSGQMRECVSPLSYIRFRMSKATCGDTSCQISSHSLICQCVFSYVPVKSNKQINVWLQSFAVSIVPYGNLAAFFFFYGCVCIYIFMMKSLPCVACAPPSLH